MDKTVTDFLRSLDRSLFLEGPAKRYADYDGPLPIGFDQTISQPSLVAYMTDALDVDKTHRILEIGTGSGYQTAFLAHFAKEVVTIERIRELSVTAKERLDDLGYHNITYIIGDGTRGWAERAPYDRIMVTAAPDEIPPLLIEQLRVGGKMVIPCGGRGHQELVLVKKAPDRSISRTKLLDVAFVPLISD
ncbi:MAG: protein-L-isoaspartate(D-aspartate) O-methyltransferase [Spirochaetales bacterium]|nr:protein-L-isoaspartate(D-aspartate) O-methyltransferase [Spirochaetales bacterium]